MFQLVITPLLIILASTLAVSLLYLVFGFRHYVAKVRGKVNADSAEELPTEEAFRYPTVSVIVYAEDDAPNLEVLLPQLLSQDYPTAYEVIVVNDGAIPATKDVIARLEREHSNLYMTFTPGQSRSLSRKKLAITLGIKAARYETVFHTTGNCQVPSKLWLKSMARHFIPGKDIVIGYAAPAAAADETPESNRRLHAFDQVLTAIEYLSWAIAGRPYRGTCHNLAYRREVFFNNKGFSRSLDLKYGDDDVFISQVSNGHNTAVELSADSMILCVENDPGQAHRTKKLRYGFTASKLRGHARLFFGSCFVAWWLSLLSAVALALFGLPSLIPLITATVLLLAGWITLMISWKRTSIALWSRPTLLTFPWFMTIYPFYNLVYAIRGMSTRTQNYSWG